VFNWVHHSEQLTNRARWFGPAPRGQRHAPAPGRASGCSARKAGGGLPRLDQGSSLSPIFREDHVTWRRSLKIAPRPGTGFGASTGARDTGSVPRRVGVRSGPNRSPLRFFPFTGARLDGSRILAAPDGADRPPSPAQADVRCSSRI
jgi:hypothetical protein